jgi:hypothetical protein
VVRPGQRRPATKPPRGVLMGSRSQDPRRFYGFVWARPVYGPTNERPRRAQIISNPDPKLFGEVLYRGLKEGV